MTSRNKVLRRVTTICVAMYHSASQRRAGTRRMCPLGGVGREIGWHGGRSRRSAVGRLERRRLLSTELSVARILANLEAQMKGHQEREAHHSAQETFHREQRTLHAAEYETIARLYEGSRRRPGAPRRWRRAGSPRTSRRREPPAGRRRAPPRPEGHRAS